MELSRQRARARWRADRIVTPHALYRGLAPSEEARCAAYRRLFEGEMGAELLQRLRACTNRGFVFGSGRFERQIAAMVGRQTWKGALGRPPKTAVEEEQQQIPS